MSVFKEECYVIAEFKNRQKQIYADSCDYGVFLNAREREILREAVQELRKYCHTKKVVRDEGITGRGTTTEIFVGWETEGECINGTMITIRTWTAKYGDVVDESKTLFEITMEAKTVTMNSIDNWSDNK